MHGKLNIRLGGRDRPRVKRFQAAVRAERKEWNWDKLGMAAEATVIAFCWCVSLRLDGQDPTEVMNGMVVKPEPDWRAD